MRVLLTGASGFVGRAVGAELVRRGHGVHALVRRGGTATLGAGVVEFKGALEDGQSLRRAATGCEAAIHLVGIIEEKPKAGVTFRSVHVEGTRNVLAALRDCGVRRVVHMSALGTRGGAVSEYHKTKWEAEEMVRGAGGSGGSGLEWTIFRPSLIHGEGGEFMGMVRAWAEGRAAPWVFMPYFGRGVLGMGERGGKARVGPVFVGDVARAFVDAVEGKGVGGTFALAGAEEMTWPGFLRGAAKRVRGREKAAVGIPAWYGRLLARTLPRKWLPFNLAQVQMAVEDNVATGEEMRRFEAEFGWRPRGFGETGGYLGGGTT